MLADSALARSSPVYRPDSIVAVSTRPCWSPKTIIGGGGGPSGPAPADAK